MHDEQHYVFFDAHKGARPFLTNRGSDGRESCAGYSFVHGRGRVCFLAPGASGDILVLDRTLEGQSCSDSHAILSLKCLWLGAGHVPLTSRRHPGQIIPDGALTPIARCSAARGQPLQEARRAVVVCVAGEPDAISHPMVQRLFHNAVRWLAAGPEPEPQPKL